jgi:hypothetical protein
MRGCAFIDNARIRARVNSENHNTPTGLATSFEMPKEKVLRRKAPPWWLYALLCYITTIDGPRCVMTYRHTNAGSLGSIRGNSVMGSRYQRERRSTYYCAIV